MDIVGEELTNSVSQAMTSILGTDSMSDFIGDFIQSNMSSFMASHEKELEGISREKIREQLTFTPEFTQEVAKRKIINSLLEAASFYAHMRLYGMESQEIDKKVTSSLEKILGKEELAQEAAKRIKEKTSTLSEKELRRAKNGSTSSYYDTCSSLVDLME